MIGILLSCGADKNVYAKTKKAKWTATIAKKKYTYTGKKIKPKVTVKYKGKKLPKKNYTVKYPKYPVDDGKYKIKVTLKGKYKGKKLKGTKIIKYKIYDPDLYYHPEEEKKNPDDVLVEKTVKGMTIAYNKGKFPFGRSIQTDKESGAKVEYAQCYFPVFIKQKINQDFVVHTEYNGSCGFNNFSNKQYIPNRKDAQVITKVSAYYYYEDDVTKPYDELQQSLYNKGYIGYVMINVSCLLNKEQSIDLYFGAEKFPLNEYNTINELMKGDYETDPYQYDAFDWRTWRNYL